MADVVTMPKLGFDMAEGTLVRWVVSEGESVQKGQVLAEIETDKATVEVEAMTSGVVVKHLISEGTITPIGTAIAVIAEAGEDVDIDALIKQIPEAEIGAEEKAALPAAELEPAESGMVKATVPGGNGHLPDGVRASPLARKMADDYAIDLSTLTGTGPGGRIVKRDIEEAMQEAPSRPSIGLPAFPARSTQETERIPLSKLRAAIGRRMVAAKQQAPHFYITSDIDASALMTLRTQANTLLSEEEKLSVNDFIVRAAALALQEFPNLNASLGENEIVRHGEINIGIAVAVEEGLLTVVVKNADLKSIRQISSEVRAMVARTREGKVRPEDIEGSTFTVSNLGMFDVDHFIAIINPPEAAILAIGSVRQVPVVREGEIVPGLRLECTVSADHRVTDGAEAARWLQVFKNYMEQPLKLML